MPAIPSPDYLERYRRAIERPLVVGGAVLAVEAIGLGIAQVAGSYMASNQVDEILDDERATKERKIAKTAGTLAGAGAFAFLTAAVAQAGSLGGGIAIGNLLGSVGTAVTGGLLTGALGVGAGATVAVLAGPIAVFSASAAAVSLARKCF